jgi:hypothetical protein
MVGANLIKDGPSPVRSDRRPHKVTGEADNGQPLVIWMDEPLARRVVPKE